MAFADGKSLSLHIPGEEHAQDGLRFLHDVRNGICGEIKGTAAVIGGGNTAIDVVRSLTRMGANALLVYRRRRQDMPAFGHEVDMAVAEGIQIRELLSPVRMEKDEKGLLLRLQKMKISDKVAGRVSVIPDEGFSETMRVDHVFTAIGAEPDEDWYLPPRKSSDVLEMPFCTFWNRERPIVYGGDLTNPVKSVTDAIASGKAAAIALDTFFQKGYDAIAETLNSCRVGTGNALSMEIYLSGDRKKRRPHTVSFGEINTDYFPNADRGEPRILVPEERIRNFSEVEKTFEREAVLSEAGRCFNCGISNDCDNCRVFCPELAIFIDGNRCINYDYCKGCGICVTECPRNAMSLEEEML
ncbi:MAG: FAD-dependent oxidoreductase [Desulfobacterales bacterium]